MNSFISMNIIEHILKDNYCLLFRHSYNSNSNMISSVGRKLKKRHVHWFFMHCVFTNLISCQNTQNTMAWCGINGIWCTRKILIPEGVLQWVTVYGSTLEVSLTKGSWYTAAQTYSSWIQSQTDKHQYWKATLLSTAICAVCTTPASRWQRSVQSWLGSSFLEIP